MTDEIVYEVTERIASIKINRPQAMNAINDAVRQQLPAALDRAAADEEVRCIIVTGAGDRAFCAGADLKENTFHENPSNFRRQRKRTRWIGAFDRNPKPIIAAIRGVCLGGGLEIALACDLRVASSDAAFGFPETQYGIIPGAGGTQRIAHIVGLGVALDMVLTGRRITAQEAMALNLVSRVAEPDAVYATALEIARNIASRPPTATQYAKEAVRLSVLQNLATGLERELDLAALLMTVDERSAGLDAFREKKNKKS